MKKSVKIGIAVCFGLLLLVGIVSIIFILVQQHMLKQRSLEYLDKLNGWYHPTEIYGKMNDSMSEEDEKIIEDIINNQVEKYVDQDSKYFQMVCTDIREVVYDEMTLKPEERIKQVQEKCVRTKKAHVTFDTAVIHLTVEEKVEAYNGSVCETTSGYIFYFRKIGKKWKIIDLDYDYSDLV